MNRSIIEDSMNYHSYIKKEGYINYHGKEVGVKYIQPENTIATIVAIGGTGGGFYGPSYIYDELAETLPEMGISVLRIDVSPDHINGAENVLIGLEYLKKINNFNPILLMGWSMGGASIIQVAKYLQQTREFQINGLITLAGQSYGADPVSDLYNIPIYIFHGTADRCMGPNVAKSIYRMANEPKELYLLKGASHFMNESDYELKQNVYDCIFRSFFTN